MKSTSSALTPRKIAEFCKARLTSIFTEGEVRLLYSCLVDLLERNEYPPYRGSGLDLQSLSAMLDIDVERLRANRAHLQPIFDAVAREVSNVTLRPARTPSRSIRSKATAPSTSSADVSATGLEKVRRKPGVRPRAIVEFPEPLDTTWNDPATFGEALQLHARRHGETIYHLYNAVVRPEDGVNRSTLISWGRGKKVPRAAISLEILGRIERRYRLSAGYFLSLSGTTERAPGDFDLDDISPSERRRLAWHLPEDFNRRPSQEKAEILNWVRTVIISGSTDYRRYQAAAIRQRYAVRFSCASGPVRKSSSARTPEESGIIIAPKRLNDEMAELLRFKTSTFAAFGMQRNGVWGTETASQKVEHFGLWFGAFVAPPESEVQGLGVDPKLLTFAMMIFPQVWDWYLHWRERGAASTRNGRSTCYRSPQRSVGKRPVGCANRPACGAAFVRSKAWSPRPTSAPCSRIGLTPATACTSTHVGGSRRSTVLPVFIETLSSPSCRCLKLQARLASTARSPKKSCSGCQMNGTTPAQPQKLFGHS